MAVVHSKLSNLALLALAGACFATAITLVYILRKPVREEFVEEDSGIQTSRYTVVEVPVPSQIVGAVIGRQGANIESIQDITFTKINFTDGIREEGSRVALIRGSPENVHEAEKLLRAAVEARLNVATESMWVPSKICGAVIGKNGSNIRLIHDISKAKVKVDSNPSRGELSRIAITGTYAEVTSAKMLIQEKINEFQERDSKNPLLAVEGHLLLCDTPTVSKKKSAPEIEDLIPTGQDGFLEVYVSSISSPDNFWVQPVGINFSTELDKLIEKMTTTYTALEGSEDYLLPDVMAGDIVVARFPHDDKWYRAVVRSFSVDDYEPGNTDVEIIYSDFGDIGMTKLKDLRLVKSAFIRLPFQAVECRLAGISPVGGTWSPESYTFFETITHCTLWKPLMLRVVGEIVQPDDEDAVIKLVELVDTNGESDSRIKDAMIEHGFAVCSKSVDS
ncbi:hypothetical protein CHUAL_000284 [Chamberlinius hualienensis]